jgi:hypothetical protein
MDISSDAPNKFNLSPEELAQLATLKNPDDPDVIAETVADQKYTVTPEIEQQFLSLLWKRPEFQSLIKPEHFNNAARHIIGKLIADHTEQYGSPPKLATVEQLIQAKLSDDKYRALVLAEWQTVRAGIEPELWDEEFLVDEATKFARVQSCRKLAAKLGQLEKEGKCGAMQDLIERHQLPQFTPKKRRAFGVKDYLGLPKSKFLVRKHLVERSLTMIYGPSGAGKSFFGLDLSFAVATGRKLLDRWEATKGGVVYLVSEGDGSFGVRLEAYMRHHALTTDDVGNLTLIPEAFNFQEEEKTVNDIRAVLKRDRPGLPVDVVFVDTLNKNIMGDENNPKDMQAFIKTCEAIRKAFNCAVAVIHHTGKDDSRGARGHSSLFAACDTVLKVEGASDSDAATVFVEKQKSGRAGWKYRVNKTVVEVDPTDPDNPDSVVLTYLGDEMPLADKVMAFANLFPTGREHAVTVRDVFDKNDTIFEAMGWGWEAARKQAPASVVKGILAEGESVMVNHKPAKTYFRICEG